MSAKVKTVDLRNTFRRAQSLTRPRSTLIITHTPLTAASPMRSGPSKLSGKRRSSLHVGDAVHQGRTGRVVDIPFTRETAAVRYEGGGLAVILVGFGSLWVKGAEGIKVKSQIENAGDNSVQRLTNVKGTAISFACAPKRSRTGQERVRIWTWFLSL
jgi:hypothetical protein